MFQKSKLLYVALLVLLLFTLGVTIVLAEPGITPASVEEFVFPGESFSLEKTVGTPEFPPMLDVCLLEDETGSFGDDIHNLKTAAPALYDSITAVAPDSYFAVHGFRDYPIAPYGSPGDWVHRKLSAMSADKTVWVAGVNALSAGGGYDTPEAQFDAIFEAVAGADACEWRVDPDVTRVLLVATDAPFHGPDGTHINDLSSTSAVLAANNIKLIGLKAPGAGGELDSLASATGGTVQAISSDGANIATAIVAGLGNLEAEVMMQSDCGPPIGTVFAPPSRVVISGDNALFLETISVAAGAAGGTYTCSDTATVNGALLVDEGGSPFVEEKRIHVPGIVLEPKSDTNELGFDLDHTLVSTVSAGDFGPVEGVRVETTVTAGPNSGASGFSLTDGSGQEFFTYTPAVEPASLGDDSIQACFTNADGSVIYGCDTAEKFWVDTTPPEAACSPSINPGGNEPPAPGKGGKGQNQDGFYNLSAVDVVWPEGDLLLYVTDAGSGHVFGPFPSGTNIKYIQAKGAKPSIKDMSGNGSGGVDWKIQGKGDAILTAVDGSGNTSAEVWCLVPPRPQ